MGLNNRMKSGMQPFEADRIDTYSLLVKSFIEGLMMEERKLFNEKHSDSSNGFRYRKFYANSGQRIDLAVPRVRKGKFIPAILRSLTKQRNEIDRLCFLLHSNGEHGEETQELFAKLYEAHYDKEQFEKLFTQVRSNLKTWRKRALEKKYNKLVIDQARLFSKEDAQTVTTYFAIVSAILPGPKGNEILGVYRYSLRDRNAWNELFDDLKKRSVENVNYFACESELRIKEAIQRAYPYADVESFVSD